ncbi:VOC family protein [Microbispora sp. CA-102843]|uniref:VOC family protein n=1 Tax=Microbispora sp. CA-102843 TaxID=3239952 RepID=UPI003D8CB40E
MTTGANLFSSVGRVVVLVDDPDEALAFYGDVLGFTVLPAAVRGGCRAGNRAPVGRSSPDP